MLFSQRKRFHAIQSMSWDFIPYKTRYVLGFYIVEDGGGGGDQSEGPIWFYLI